MSLPIEGDIAGEGGRSQAGNRKSAAAIQRE